MNVQLLLQACHLPAEHYVAVSVFEMRAHVRPVAAEMCQPLTFQVPNAFTHSVKTLATCVLCLVGTAL